MNRTLEDLVIFKHRVELLIESIRHELEIYERMTFDGVDKEDRLYYSGLMLYVVYINEYLMSGSIPEFVYDDYDHPSWSALADTVDELCLRRRSIDLNLLYDLIENRLPEYLAFFEQVRDDLSRRIDEMRNVTSSIEKC